MGGIGKKEQGKGRGERREISGEKDNGGRGGEARGRAWMGLGEEGTRVMVGAYHL